MAGVYFHFPFCKQACTYCNFHFSTSLNKKNLMIKSMLKELKLRKDFFNNDIVDSIYFGGGTPSLIDAKLIGEFILSVKENFKVSDDVEITLELNPDDSSLVYLNSLKQNHVNAVNQPVVRFIVVVFIVYASFIDMVTAVLLSIALLVTLNRSSNNVSSNNKSNNVINNNNANNNVIQDLESNKLSYIV